MKLRFSKTLILFLIGLVAFSCKKEVGPCENHNISYEGEIKEIIQNSCAFSVGCHSGIWQVLPDFSNYSGLKPSLEDGLFEERLFTSDSNLIMPPLHNVPMENQLSGLQLELLTCWLNAGFPEK